MADETDDAPALEDAQGVEESAPEGESPAAEEEDSPQEDSSGEASDGATDDGDENKPFSRLWGVLRLVAYVGVVLIVIGTFMAGTAYRDVQDHALDVGNELGKLGDIGPKVPITLNGQPIHVGSSMHTLSVTETLDRAEAYCRGEAPTNGDGASAFFDENSPGLAPRGEPNFQAIRRERDGRGVVLCFAPRDGEPPIGGPGEKIMRFMTFMETGDLAALGEFQYMFARPTDAGGTHLVRVWTPESFNLYSMTSTGGGDAPGTDPADMPRPPNARRLLSATVPNVAYANRVYESSSTPEEILETYDRTMPERGWELKVRRKATRVYNREQVSVFVTPIVRDGRTLVSVLHMGDDPGLALEGR